MSIIIENLSKVINGKKILDDISFTIPKNKITGLLGKNGAGKSTIMSILTENLEKTSGKIYLSDQKKIEKKNIGYLSENNPLYQEMYALEFLEFIAKIYHVPKSIIPERCKSVLEKCSLLDKKNFKVKNLSRGYKQRLGIAKTIIHDPEILILDEPTSGLDFQNIIDVRNLILSIAKTKTVLISSHIMEDIEEMCQEIILINNGKIQYDSQNLSEEKNSIIYMKISTKNENSLNSLDPLLAKSSILKKNNDAILLKATYSVNEAIIEVLPLLSSLNIEVKKITFSPVQKFF